jgi:hypothetical protein
MADLHQFGLATGSAPALDLGRQAYAHFGSRKADGYLRLPIKDRAVKLRALVW